MSVNELENLIRQKKKRGLRHKRGSSAYKDPYIQAIEEQLQQILGSKVTINKGRKRGHISIEFYTNEDLERIINKIR